MEFIDIYAALTDNEYERYGQEYPEESSTMAGAIQRAREEGVRRGMERGHVEGERTVLERLLRRRFGRLPAGTERRLDRASRADLEAWADNVLDARSLDEVFG